MTLHIALVVGTRPQIIKSVPIINAARKNRRLRVSLIHTGQHYDYDLSKLFFSQFDLPEPVANLGVGSSSHPRQIGEIMIRLEPELQRIDPECVLVPGDTNSALAAGLTANKMRIPVAHVESGARSYEPDLPEETNRLLLDHVCTLDFAPSLGCVRNLRAEGIPRDRILLTGDTMFDVFKRYQNEIIQNGIVERLQLSDKSFILLTIHRESNIENKQNLKDVVNAILSLTSVRFVWPVHPHTRARLKEFGLFRRVDNAGHVKMIDPVGYFETIKLGASALLVATDSGGLQKEAFWMGTPCVTLRTKTEWIETVRVGANILCGTSQNKVIAAIERNLRKPQRIRNTPNPFGDGRASERIVRAMLAQNALHETM